MFSACMQQICLFFLQSIHLTAWLENGFLYPNTMPRVDTVGYSRLCSDCELTFQVLTSTTQCANKQHQPLSLSAIILEHICIVIAIHR